MANTDRAELREILGTDYDRTVDDYDQEDDSGDAPEISIPGRRLG